MKDLPPILARNVIGIGNPTWAADIARWETSTASQDSSLGGLYDAKLPVVQEAASADEYLKSHDLGRFQPLYEPLPTDKQGKLGEELDIAKASRDIMAYFYPES